MSVECSAVQSVTEPPRWWACVAMKSKLQDGGLEASFWTLKRAIDAAGEPMRAPVRILVDGDKQTLCFLTSKKVEDKDTGVYAFEAPTRRTRTTTFGGWVSYEKAARKKDEIEKCTPSSGTKTEPEWAIDQYNMPIWPLIGRRNAVVVFEK